VDRKDIAKSLDLDATTSRLLVRLAKIWHVSEAEAVRRALEQANSRPDSQDKESRLDAFTELQRRLRLTPAKAAEWQEVVRETRR
jgi:hypothetical protein